MLWSEKDPKIILMASLTDFKDVRVRFLKSCLLCITKETISGAWQSKSHAPALRSGVVSRPHSPLHHLPQNPKNVTTFAPNLHPRPVRRYLRRLQIRLSTPSPLLPYTPRNQRPRPAPLPRPPPPARVH